MKSSDFCLYIYNIHTECGCVGGLWSLRWFYEKAIFFVSQQSKCGVLRCVGCAVWIFKWWNPPQNKPHNDGFWISCVDLHMETYGPTLVGNICYHKYFPCFTAPPLRCCFRVLLIGKTVITCQCTIKVMTICQPGIAAAAA